jgi:hypothetical protein
METEITEDDLLFILIPKDQNAAIFRINSPSVKESTEVINTSSKSGKDIKPGKKYISVSIEGHEVIYPEYKRVDFDRLWETSINVEWIIGTPKKVVRKGTGYISRLNLGLLEISSKNTGNDCKIEIRLQCKG